MYDDIALFIKLVEIANYTKAANILNITQPTLSRRIKNLETVLGIGLIDRNSRNFELTEQGCNVYQQLVAPIKQLQTNLMDFTQNTNTLRGTLKIALPAALSYELITPFINKFTGHYPEIKLLITYTARPIDLIRDNYNLAVSTLMPTSQDSKVRLLKKFSFKLYASPDYIKQYGTPQDINEIKLHKSIGMIDIDGSIRNNYLATNLISGKESVLRHEPNIYINNILHGIQIAKTGDFIVGVWDDLITQELMRGELIPVLPDYIFGELPCYLIRHNHTSSKLEQIFIDFLISCFN